MDNENFLSKKVNWKVLKVFMDNPSQAYSFSDLVALTKSGPTNVKKAVNELKNNNFFISKTEGNKILYKINLNDYSVKYLFLFYAWNRINKFPKKVREGLRNLVNDLIPKKINTIYLFGSSINKTNPNDFDLAVIYNKRKEELNKIWIENIKDFEENIEVHFFQKEEFIKFFKEGNYRITSTLMPCLVLYDENFIFNYLGNILLPNKTILLREIKNLEEKLNKCFSLYKDRKEDCRELMDSSFNDFLRIYIAYQKEIPSSKHVLKKQARKLGLDIKKRNLWEKLEWMEKIIKKMKISI